MRKSDSNSIYKTFDLSKSRPKVLLIGNGFNLLVGNNLSNYSIVNNLFKFFQPKLKKQEREVIVSEIPFSLAVMLTINSGDQSKAKNLDKALTKDELLKTKYKDNPILEELLMIGFDAVLTTNFTYECERLLDDNFDNKDKYIKTNNIVNGKTIKEKKYLLKTYNQIKKDNTIFNIWHIHGEIRKTNSFISGIPDYNGLITRINNYISNSYKNESIRFDSWIDYLLYGDVYVVGNGFSYYEFDLWQLLYKKRYLKNGGKTIFYEPKSDKDFAKQKVLKLLNVDVRNLGVKNLETGCSLLFEGFYKKAINNIKKEIAKEK